MAQVHGKRTALAWLLGLLVLHTAATAQFEIRGSFVALPPSDPLTIAMGDFNHDGKLDLAVVSDLSGGGVSILIGKGDGTFEWAVQYAAGDQPFSIVAADFDNDGNLDLAVANSLSPYVSILMGNGDGTFRPQTETPPVNYATFVNVGDFNGDGIPDLVALTGYTISVLMGNGDGTFQDPIITQPAFSTAAIGIGDFNRDGKLDLAAAGQFGTECEVNILLGNGDGTFRQGASYAGDRYPESIFVGDFNGDHKLDFAVANLEGVGIGVWIGNGDGTFEQGVNYAATSPLWVTGARLSGSGPLDIVAASFTDGVDILTGNGDGTFQPAVSFPGGNWDTYVV
ncbi:MAG TPA: VCBS repeat-containing protein, partial [Candidatus Binatia bacterium]|nr:VCBS repeat-containing protein [Candidatus Binatia bacterium]